MLDTATYRACPSCGSDAFTPWEKYSPEAWQVVCCNSCRLTYLRNPVAYTALEEDFAWEKTYVEKSARGGSTTLSPLIRRLRARLGLLHRSKTDSFRAWFHDGHVLDIGCGLGDRIVPPMTPYGIELSKGLQAEADTIMRKRGGYCLHGAGAEAIWAFSEGQFDGILMNSYLEHETDVMGVLKGAYRALKETGAVYVRVPNFGSLNRRVIGANWCGFRYPDHVNYFTLDTLKSTVARAGFTLELVNGKRLMLDDNIQALLRKQSAA
ncbi:MAG: class I SAM-dependent methyltransferase [Roseobacter sp.]|nr:class I SAM-dependent methyltransferase [Roseobacter sp.]